MQRCLHGFDVLRDIFEHHAARRCGVGRRGPKGVREHGSDPGAGRLGERGQEGMAEAGFVGRGGGRLGRLEEDAPSYADVHLEWRGMQLLYGHDFLRRRSPKMA